MPASRAATSEHADVQVVPYGGVLLLYDMPQMHVPTRALGADAAPLVVAWGLAMGDGGGPPVAAAGVDGGGLCLWDLRETHVEGEWARVGRESGDVVIRPQSYRYGEGEWVLRGLQRGGYVWTLCGVQGLL